MRLKDSEEQLYRDFLLLTGQLRVSSGNEVEGAAAETLPSEKEQVIHFSYAPLADYGRGGLFFPSSSLLETGGTISLYNGKETSLKPVLKNEANLDNTRTLRSIIQQLSS